MMPPSFAGYSDVSLVGQGGLGRVYRATRVSTGGVVAIKELPDVASASSAWHRARRELEALLRLKGHAGVVSVEEIFEGPSGPCIVMEFMPGGSLNDRLSHGPVSVPEAVLVGQQVSQALSAAHQAGIIHRDVKPHNLMVNGFGQIKVCDFGISALNRGDGSGTQTNAMTLAYASPEELDGSQTVGPPADVYSFAATMQHLITGCKPTFHERMGGGLPAQLAVGGPVMGPLGHAIEAGLSRHPAERPTMTQFVAVFDSAASALGPSRGGALGIEPGRADYTLKRDPVQPLISSYMLPTVTPPMTYSAGNQPVVDATVVRTTAEYPPTQQQFAPGPFDTGQRPTRRWDRYVFAAIAVVALVVGGVVAILGTRHTPQSAPSLSSGDTKLASAATPTAVTVVRTGAPITVLVTSAAPVPTVPVATTAPATSRATLTPVPVTVLVPVPAPAATVPVIAVSIPVPPTQAPGPTFFAVSQTDATNTLSTWVAAMNNGDMNGAWQLAGPLWRNRFGGDFARFSCMESQFQTTSIDQIISNVATAHGRQLIVQLSYVLASGPSVEQATIAVANVGFGPQIYDYVPKSLGGAGKLNPTCA
jgi:serine/threonine protein kinase